MNIFDKVTETNRIEGIHRSPTPEEISEHERFIRLEKLSVEQLEAFVKVYQPNAILRDKPGLDVRVGNHFPPRGGEHIRTQLMALLDDINAEKIDAWEAHIQYETLHPFTDGNGRSGRAIWYWMMLGHPFDRIGFLHAFYYQSLQNVRLHTPKPLDSETRAQLIE